MDISFVKIVLNQIELNLITIVLVEFAEDKKYYSQIEGALFDHAPFFFDLRYFFSFHPAEFEKKVNLHTGVDVLSTGVSW